MPHDHVYLPTYKNSWALVVGINRYINASPLGYASQDATVFSKLLESKLKFNKSNIKLLLDEDATQDVIRKEFLYLTENHVSEDDRVVIFYAGHGYTRTGHRGEVGYLVPVDGDPNKLETLIRWDEFTRNADLVRAKHVLFIMDACYGGLAIMRASAPGSSRFLKDMLQRYSRQVLTAGKADEVVADCGGPRVGHSIFTGHLLDGLEGAAATSDGTITANSVMAYVYDRVAKDINSKQTPHYGFLDGDGDLIFIAPTSNDIKSDNNVDQDILITMPPNIQPQHNEIGDLPIEDIIKEYLSDPKYKIRLDDLIKREIRSYLYNTREELYPLNVEPYTPEVFSERLRRYEGDLDKIISLTVLVSHWGGNEYQSMLERIIARLAEQNEPRAGNSILIEMRWYPILLLMYCGGISSIASGNYMSIKTLFMTQLVTQPTGSDNKEAIIHTLDNIIDIERYRSFNGIPGHEKHFVPRSEYMYKAIQSKIDDILYIGKSYDTYYDNFEILLALTFADLSSVSTGTIWGPPGRFGWKHRRGFGKSSYDLLVDEAKRDKSNWPPIKAGLFGGSIERFLEIASKYRDDTLNRLPFY